MFLLQSDFFVSSWYTFYMKLLLTSNGLLNTPLEKDFLEMTDNKTNLKVVIIPTASDPIEWVPEKEGDQIKDYVYKLIPERIEKNVEWVKTYKEEWNKKGYNAIIADLKEDPLELKEKIKSADVIDVLGGDVNYLLDWSKKSKLDTYLSEVLNKGVVYVGTSAGSGLINPDIGLTWWSPDWKLDHIGLAIVDFIVVPHQKESDISSNIENLVKRRDYLQTIINFPWRIYLLQDGQAIKVIDNNVEHIGSGIKRYI
jgi:peptidase E